MGWFPNSLTADGWGVRVGDDEFPLRAFSWDAVTQLRAYLIPDIKETIAVVEVHHDDDWEEILSNWADFPEVAAGLSAHLPGIRPDWLDAVLEMSAEAGPATVWARDA